MKATPVWLAVTGGKDGIGKTSIALNLAVALAGGNCRCCLVDFDGGLANAAALLGCSSAAEQTPAVADLDARFLPATDQVTLLCDAMELLWRLPEADPAEDDLQRLARRLAEFDYIVVDMPGGFDTSALGFLARCDHALVVTTPEANALTDTFTLVKTLARHEAPPPVSLVVNMAADEAEAERLTAHFQAAARQYVHFELNALGHVAMDRAVTSAVLRGRAFMEMAPDAPAARCIARIASGLSERWPPARGEGRLIRRFLPDGEAPAAAGPAEPQTQRAPSPVEPPVEPAPRASALGDTLERLAEQLELALAAETVSEAQARRLFGRVEKAFTRRFRRRASDLKTMIYEALLQNSLGRDEQRDMIQTLIAAYGRRHGNASLPAEPPPDLTALTEEQLLDALQPLTVRFGVDSVLARRLLSGWVRSAAEGVDWSGEDSLKLVRELDRAYRRRHGEPLVDVDAGSREAFARSIQTRRARLARLREEMQALEEDQASLEALLRDVDGDGDTR